MCVLLVAVFILATFTHVAVIATVGCITPAALPVVLRLAASTCAALRVSASDADVQNATWTEVGNH
jgi:hypothetical protein